MDQALALIEGGQAHEGVHLVVEQLARTRRTLEKSAWRSFAEGVRSHPIADHLYADPFTHRAYAKPRGYAGDAVMMDCIYGRCDEFRAALSETAAAIFDYTTNWAACPRSVRARRAKLAETIDEVTDSLGRSADVVAFAAGHLREVELSSAVARGEARITAIDADAESLEEVSRSYAALGISTCRGSVRQVLSGKLCLPRADLVYTAGLYDYLSDAVAERLTLALFEAVRPGGTLLIANFLPDVLDVGYMEAFMDWHLVYRTDSQMLDLARALPAASVGHLRQFHDLHHNITFLEVTRR